MKESSKMEKKGWDLSGKRGKRKRRELFLLVSCGRREQKLERVLQLGDTTGTRLTTEVITTSCTSTRKQLGFGRVRYIWLSALLLVKSGCGD